MPLVLRLKPFESSKGFDGAAVGREATPLRVVTVTGLSCKGRSPRSVDRGGLEACGDAMRERSRCAPPTPLLLDSLALGGRGRESRRHPLPLPTALGGCCGPMSRRCECGGAWRIDGLPQHGCPSTGPLREPEGVAAWPGPRRGDSGLGWLALPRACGRRSGEFSIPIPGEFPENLDQDTPPRPQATPRERVRTQREP